MLKTTWVGIKERKGAPGGVELVSKEACKPDLRKSAKQAEDSVRVVGTWELGFRGKKRQDQRTG